MAHHDGGIRFARGKGITDRGGGDDKLTHGSLLRVARLERTEVEKRRRPKRFGNAKAGYYKTVTLLLTRQGGSGFAKPIVRARRSVHPIQTIHRRKRFARGVRIWRESRGGSRKGAKLAKGEEEGLVECEVVEGEVI